jgi:hypothetical protein
MLNLMDPEVLEQLAAVAVVVPWVISLDREPVVAVAAAIAKKYSSTRAQPTHTQWALAELRALPDRQGLQAAQAVPASSSSKNITTGNAHALRNHSQRLG